MSYYNELKKFLDQAKTEILKTKHFQSSYLDTNVSVSFGQGNPARIPWISFLLKPNVTSKGIYPVYLYYKQEKLLILAFGVSEKYESPIQWRLNNKMSIQEYFAEQELGKPIRYGSSYIFKVYDVEDLPEKKILDRDLSQIIKVYLSTMKETKISGPGFSGNLKTSFLENINSSGLIFNDQIITRFLSSLITKPFVILTGLSGSGKTKLAQAFVQWICADKDQYRIIPVGADWTNREPLLGFPDALNPDNYVLPESGALQIILEAAKEGNENKPYFLILDEMNLSQVERYFADFLSGMESGEEIPLHSAKKELTSSTNKDLKIPRSIAGLPKNLFIIGTVNIDETTYMFSPKVLDRANTIEFRVRKDDLHNFFKNGALGINLNIIEAKGQEMASDFLVLSKKTELKETKEEITATLLQFFNELKVNGAEFGYRSAYEILLLIQQLGIIDTNMTEDEKLDIAIMQKLLPKLHGRRRKIIPVLEKLGQLCLLDGTKFEEILKQEEDYSKARFPLSLEKAVRMHKRAIENGYTSFAEA